MFPVASGSGAAGGTSSTSKGKQNATNGGGEEPAAYELPWYVIFYPDSYMDHVTNLLWV